MLQRLISRYARLVNRYARLGLWLWVFRLARRIIWPKSKVVLRRKIRNGESITVNSCSSRSSQ